MKQVFAILVVLLLVLFGCSKQTTEPNQSTDMSTTAKEAVLQYGATDDGALPAATVVPIDSLRKLLADTSIDLYSITAVWGVVKPAAPPMPPFAELNWKGGMGVNGVGFMKLVSPILFERPQDSILPSPAPTAIAWASRTTWDIDGVTVLLALKHGVTYVTPPVLGIRTLPLSADIPLPALDKLDTLLPVDNINGMLLHSRKLPHLVCPMGLAGGKWIRGDNTFAFGHFEGAWRDANGKQVGFLMGKFWTDGDNRLFEGQYTDMEKTAVGHIKGMWRFDDPRDCVTCGQGMGAFLGRIFDLNDVEIGGIEGRFGPSDNAADQLILPFGAKWRYKCPDKNDGNSLIS